MTVSLRCAPIWVRFRIFLDLDAPSLVVCQVPVEAVHIVQGKNIDELLDRIYREEVPGNIEVHTAIRETPDSR